MTTVSDAAPSNGAGATAPPEEEVPRNASPALIFKVLEERYQVPRHLVDQLGRAIFREFIDIIADAVNQKSVPQGYFILHGLVTRYFR
jgi:hypothetical protein